MLLHQQQFLADRLVYIQEMPEAKHLLVLLDPLEDK
jgi:hypothetical protein